MDPSFGRWARAMPLLAIAIVGAVTGVLQRTYDLDSTPKSAAVVASAVIVVAIGASIAMRRKIFDHAYNRRVWALLVVTLVAIFVNRITVLVTGGDILRCLTDDLIIISVAFGAGAVVVTPRLFAAAAVVAVTWVAAMMRPAWTPVLFRISIVVPGLLGTWAIVTSRRAELRAGAPR
jgi:hypothetical protein